MDRESARRLWRSDCTVWARREVVIERDKPAITVRRRGLTAHGPDGPEHRLLVDA
jgi:hypothetical protein